MIVAQASYQKYSVPFRVPFTSSRGLEQQRDGFVLRLDSSDGRTGYGDAVPLPAFGTGTLDVLERALEELVPRIQDSNTDIIGDIDNELSGDTKLSPVRFALDTALFDLLASEQGSTVSKYLCPDAASSVPLNATISDMDAEGAASAASYAAMAGYQAIKMKVGALIDVQMEVDRVAAVREAIGPSTELRLDVNGAWSFERAVEMSRALEPYDIGYLEQPLPASDVEASARLRREIEIPLAADEAVTSREALEELIELDAVDTVIIKPTIVGGLTAGRELIELAYDNDIRVVVTTAIESGVAITAALHLAATLKSPIPPCGLATAALLETDLLVESPHISGGHMHVPDSPGLGVQPIGSVWTGQGH